ncbi:Scd6-like Sm domain-containing protein [Tirmania nivea]|nr:Scd6-like Sm domain-containing protein [Tirmania nivea]
MSEFIGYVGILHEINSENSTVALEQVVSFGTEGRRGDPAKEIPATDNIYEYIVFRGSDVKDLRIEEQAKTPQQKPPQVPDDPAILQSTARPPSYASQGLSQYPAPPMHPYYQQNPARYGYPPNPYGYPGYSPVGPPGVGQFPPQASQQASQQQPQQQQQPQPQPIGGYPRQGPPSQAPIGPATNRPQQGQPQPLQQAIAPRGVPQQTPQPQAQQAPKPAEQQAKPTTPVPQPQPAPSAPNAKLPAPMAAQDGVKAAAPQPVAAPQDQAPKPTNNTACVKGRSVIVPALPLASASRQGFPTLTPASVAPTTATNAAAAPTPKSTTEINDTAAVQDLAHKVSQLKTPSTAVTSNGEGTTSTATDGTHRPARQPTNRGRGGFRASLQQTRKVEIPAGDFDFESANAKFNKQDLIKEVIASEDVPAPTPANVSTTNGAPTALEEEAKDHGTGSLQPDGFYSKKKSFFDNISCENKERAEAKEGDRPRGGAQWRGEETKKNIETFGQGSVDGGNRYVGRGGWRGRGRAYRGYRPRGSMRGSAF